MSVSISSVLETQLALLQEAAEALPHQFSQCTHNLGSIRQAVYLCRTCASPRGICSACSIACHTDHEQLELFPKRNFQCDCPTRALSHPCSLHPHLEEPNDANIYGQNFTGAFCRCGREYDAQRERETMIQCLACEDWYHESCLNLRERPSSRAPTPEQSAQNEDEIQSEASSSGLPPPRITAADYDVLVCGGCVRRVDTLRRWAGTAGVLMVVRDSPADAWKIIGTEHSSGDMVNVEEREPTVGEKRPRSNSPGIPAAKRVKPETSTAGENYPCLAPPPSALAQKILLSHDPQSDAESLGAGDIFLTDGWRERWCRCSSCLPSLKARPYLLEEEDTYEPPDDPDSGLSLEELGMRALQRLPRERAIDGIRAFNQMRDELMNHLRPFAQEGKEVTEADIRAFFDSRNAKT